MKNNNEAVFKVVGGYIEKVFGDSTESLKVSNGKTVKSALNSYMLANKHLLVKHELVELGSLSDNYLPTYFIVESSFGVQLVTIVSGRFLCEDGSEFVEPTTQYNVFYIRRRVRFLTPTEIGSALLKSTPMVSFLMLSLVAFVLVSPLFSNIFNSRLVHTDSISSLLVVSAGFTVLFVFEFLIKELIMMRVNRQIERESRVAEFVLFESVITSTNKDSIVNWKTVSDSLAGVWRGFGQIMLDAVTILLIVVFFGFQLGVYAVFPIIIYTVFFVLNVKFKYNSYRKILALSNMKDQKLTYLINMGSSNKFFRFIDKDLIREKWGAMTNDTSNFGLHLQEHEEFYNGILKLFSSVSIIVIFIASYCAIKSGSCAQSSIIALMMLNGRCSAALNSLIGRSYSAMVAYSKMTSSLAALHRDSYEQLETAKGLVLSNQESHQLIIDNVSKQVDGKVVLSMKEKLELASGDCCCITGRIGSGKTTLLDVLGGLSTVTTGKVSLDGVNITEYSSRVFAKDVAYYSINDSMIGDSLEFNLRLKYGLDLELAIENLKIFDCNYALTQQALFEDSARNLKLSSGQIQKLEMVRSLGANPSLILLDEPCSNLSAAESRLFMQKLRQRYPRSIIIFTSHSPILRGVADFTFDIETSTIAKTK
ncbi:ATP-binding cassette domain-containing protein [Photobacterium damselae]|uniref:ATP-binding cassette domain-containing protein n=1 Tax=Photobacterium damselae TaxID=38293 RepID=UPI0040687AA9